MIHPRLLRPALFALLAFGCTSKPIGAIPEPFLETLAWAAASDAEGAFLGLKVRENDSGSLDELAFEPGVRVTRVIENSPAKAAGFAVGDIVLTWDGAAVDDPRDLDELLRTASAGKSVTLETRRGDSVFAVEAILAGAAGETERPAPELLYRADPSRSGAGWLGGRGGVVLVASPEDGPFPSAGIPVKSVVMALDGVAVQSERSLIRRMQDLPPGTEVEVDYVSPEGESRSRSVELLAPPTRVTEVSVPVLFTYVAEPEDDETRFVLLDLWFISLFRYRREGGEREWRFLRFFTFSKGVGELTQ